MILVILGTQKFQFNRLLKTIDLAIEDKVINEEVFAQIGYSDYVPKHYSYTYFIKKDDFSSFLNKSDIVITHGGSGGIINSIKANN